MGEPRSLIDCLAQAQNPFAAAVVSEQDVATGAAEVPDVASIHSQARAALLKALHTARSRGGGPPQVLLITGEKGDGKSHLLAWLRRQKRGDFVFASVPPLSDPGEPFRHALRHVLSSLRRPAPSPPDVADAMFHSPLDRLVWEILFSQAQDLLDTARDGLYDGAPGLPRLLLPLCEDAGEPRDAVAFAAGAQRMWSQIEPGLLRHMLSLPQEAPTDVVARTVLVQYPHPDRRALCAAWLAGEELGADDLARLSIKHSIDSEASSRRLLTSLCRLSPQPLVLCFDQIEGTTDRLREPGLRALSDVVREVHARGGATCQVITCLSSLWPSFREKLSIAPSPSGSTPSPSPMATLVPPLLEQVALAPIEPGQVRDLVVARLALAFADEMTPPRPTPTYPFEEAEVLALAQGAGLGHARESLRFFEGEFEKRRDALVSPGQAVNASTLPPPTTDAGVLEAALRTAEKQVRAGLLETLPGARASALRAVLRELCEGTRQLPRGIAGTLMVSCDPILGGGLRLTVQPPTSGGSLPGPSRPAEQPPAARLRVATEICNAAVGPALFAAASRLGRQVQEGRANLALVLREEGLSLGAGSATAHKTMETLKRQLVAEADGQPAGRGGVLWLGTDEVVELLAAEQVLHSASAGELSAGPRAISRAEALSLLLQREGGPPRTLLRLVGRIQGHATDEARRSSFSGQLEMPSSEPGAPTQAPVNEADAAPQPQPHSEGMGQNNSTGRVTQLGLGVVPVVPAGPPRPIHATLPLGTPIVPAGRDQGKRRS